MDGQRAHGPQDPAALTSVSPSSRTYTSQPRRPSVRAGPPAAPRQPAPTTPLRRHQAEMLPCFLLPWGKVKSVSTVLFVGVSDPFAVRYQHGISASESHCQKPGKNLYSERFGCILKKPGDHTKKNPIMGKKIVSVGSRGS